ncbi:TPA: hypothetical protein MYN84_004641 [Klebsiella quasipneumoniae subsp. quasipneumoniae]|nr:hypothetical protein [Klebsiella quasipneumoniae subsp. quasipneumoniae]
MTTTPNYRTDAKRDATDSIRGYVYQIYQSIHAWLSLNENEQLYLECAEDFDVCVGQSVIGTQVKDLSGNLTLRSSDVVAAINNFWTLQENNPDHDVSLRFLTTAVAGHEKSSPLGEQVKGLEYWRLCEFNDENLERLRSFLITLPLDSKLKSFVQTASMADLRNRLIKKISWDLGSKNKDGLQQAIEAKLKLHGNKFRINTYNSCQALPHLLKKVADLLSTKGPKPLAYEDFLTEFDVATTECIPKNELEILRGSSSVLQQLINSTNIGEIERLLARAPTISTPLPIVDRALPRISLVTKLERQLSSSRVIFLHGSSGTGKTNLAVLLLDKVGGSWGWGSFRGRPVEQIREMLSRAVLEINQASIPQFLVLDDLDFNHIIHFEREFITLIFTIVQSKGMVIITGQKSPPLQLFPKLWISTECEQAIPYFDENEIGELAEIHGLYDHEKKSQWARAIYFSTLGHPQLVHARVRTLSDSGWSATIQDIAKPEDVERIRADARSRLIEEFPSDTARMLAYRLSIVSGAFRRNTVFAVAGSPPPVNLPGEVFDKLVGPWIEKEGTDLYRISPLLMGAADSVLSKDEIVSVHAKIAISILDEKELNQYGVANAFFHAFLAKEEAIMLNLAKQIIQEDEKNIVYLCDPLFWFVDVALEADQTIIGGNPSVELMLRILQYKLAVAASNEVKALKIIEVIEKIIDGFDSDMLGYLSTAMAFGTILNTLNIHIPSSIVIRQLSQLIDIYDKVDLQEALTSFAEKKYSIQSNDPIILLFSFQAVRLNGLNDLLDLITSIDSLESNKRSRLLGICDIDTNFSNLLINQACWKESKTNVFDSSNALNILRNIENKAREWNSKSLHKATLRAISVIYDEFVHSTDTALAVLDAADKEFENDTLLLNQRAKVLFHAKLYSESLNYFKRTLLLSELNDVDYVFSCRYAGIACAKLNDWQGSAAFFKMGSQVANKSKIQSNMSIGLMADAAISLWKSNKKKECLLLFADVLDLLLLIENDDNIRAHHLQATVRHCISWVHFDAIKYTDTNLVEPLSGMCSNQEPHEKIVDHRIIDISSSWNLLAATENYMNLGDDIQKRSHATTQGKLPLIMAGYDRTRALESLFKEKSFNDLIPTLIRLHEAIYYTEFAKKNNIDLFEVGEIPALPVSYWNDETPWRLNSQIIIAAYIKCFTEGSKLASLLKRWDTELQQIVTLPPAFKKLIGTLNGEKPEGNELYQRAASALIALKSNNIMPLQLWEISYWLLDLGRSISIFVSKDLEKLLIIRWTFAARYQKFAFLTPRISIAELEKACLEEKYSGIAKVASVLLITLPYLNINIPNEAKRMLEDIRDKKE